MDNAFAPVEHGGEESGGTVMASLVWLLIPVMAVCIAGLWSSWATRRRINGGGDAAGVAGYHAFRTAMERSREWEGSREPRRPEADDVPDDPQPAERGRTSARTTGGTHRSKVESDSLVEPLAEHPDQRAAPAGPRASQLREALDQHLAAHVPEGVPDRVPQRVPERVPTGVSTDSPSRAAD